MLRNIMIAFGFAVASVLMAPLAASPAWSGGDDVGNGPDVIRLTRSQPYGAYVSVEAGVRVYRPVPRADVVVVNPTDAPVDVTINKIRKETVVQPVAVPPDPYAPRRYGLATGTFRPFVRGKRRRAGKHRRFGGGKRFKGRRFGKRINRFSRPRYGRVRSRFAKPRFAKSRRVYGKRIRVGGGRSGGGRMRLQ